MTDLDFILDEGETARATPALRAHLKAIVTGPRVLGGEVPGNDVPFFLCPYVPEDEVAMQEQIAALKSELGQEGVSVLEIDLYRLAVEILKETGRWDRLLRIEARDDKSKFLSLLQSTLNEEEVLVPRIRKIVEATPHAIVFLTGLGAAFPVIRSYLILSRLQSVLKDAPTVIFFPGRYMQGGGSGFALKVLGRLSERNYYRAHNVLHMREPR